MDVIFDIDGTLASAAHRLHLIDEHGAKDWGSFLSDEMVSKDQPIPQTWGILANHLSNSEDRVIFVTGRKEASRSATFNWIQLHSPKFTTKSHMIKQEHFYMRQDGDRRSSHIVKEEGYHRSIRDGYNPTLVYEDRKSDTDMWRRNGLLCCHVAEGNF